VNVHNLDARGDGAAIAITRGMRLLVGLVTLAGCGGLTDVGAGTQPDARLPDAKIVDVKAIFKAWSGCMTLTNFQAANMVMAWTTLVTNDGKQCMNCHDYGEYNFMASDDEAAFFAGITQHSYLMSKYFTVDIPTEKVMINTTSFKAANSAAGHPKFNATMNQGMTALQTFYDATVANIACEAPKMID
jgi:hypothetical protein